MRRHRLWVGWTLGPVAVGWAAAAILVRRYEVLPWWPSAIAAAVTEVLSLLLWTFGTASVRRAEQDQAGNR